MTHPNVHAHACMQMHMHMHMCACTCMHMHAHIVTRTVYWRTQARGKQRYIVRFEKCVLCFDIGLSPSGLAQSQTKVCTFQT